MKKKTPRQYAQALLKATRGLTDKEVGAIIKNFVSLLSNQRQLKNAPRIVTALEDLTREEAGITLAQVTVAKSLPETVLSHLKKTIGEKVELIQKIDESLLGGLKLKINDKIWDGSFKTQLLNLKKHLIA